MGSQYDMYVQCTYIFLTPPSRGYIKYSLDDHPLQQRVPGAVQRSQHQPPASHLESGQPFTKVYIEKYKQKP